MGAPFFLYVFVCIPKKGQFGSAGTAHDIQKLYENPYILSPWTYYIFDAHVSQIETAPYIGLSRNRCIRQLL